MKNLQRALLLSLVVSSSVVWAIEDKRADDQKIAQNERSLAELPAAVVRLDETVISGNQELPKVLYILPWREPQGLPDIEIQAEFTEAEVFRRL